MDFLSIYLRMNHAGELPGVSLADANKAVEQYAEDRDKLTIEQTKLLLKMSLNESNQKNCTCNAGVAEHRSWCPCS